MKKIICALLMMAVCSLSFAQYVRKGATITVNGQPQDRAATMVTLSQIGGEEMAADWSAAVSQRGLGIGLTAGGFTLAAVGSILGLASGLAGGILGGTLGAAVGNASAGVDAGMKSATPLTTVCLVGAAAGLAAGIVGIVQISKGNKKMDAIVDGINAKQGTSLSFGPTTSGVGFAYRF